MSQSRPSNLTLVLFLGCLATQASATPDPLGNRHKPTFGGSEVSPRAPAPRDSDGGAEIGAKVRARSTPEVAPNEDGAGTGDSAAGGGSTSGADPGKYELGPQDQIEIELWNRAEIEFPWRPVVVTEKGTIVLPLVDAVQVGGKTVSEVTEELTRIYDDFIIEPQVFIRIVQFNSQQVSVVGEVKNPGRYALRGEMLLTQILAQAGDLTAHASQTVRIIRQGADDQSQLIEVNLTRINRGDPRENIQILPDDQVYVLTNKNIVYLSGMVKTEGYVDYEEGMTALEAVILAGGLADGAAGGRARIYRVQNGKTVEQKVNLKDQRKRIRVLPGDIIHVPKSWF